MPWRSRKRSEQAEDAAVPAIEAPNESELNWIRQNIAVARALAEQYGVSSERPLDANTLDGVYANRRADWDQQDDGERLDPNDVVNAIGLAFGQSLVDQHGLHWVVASDEHGTEIAVHGSKGDLLVYPTNLVGKRFESGETGFLAPIAAEVAARVAELRS
jgi:Domain of unknown function (DUF3806)